MSYAHGVNWATGRCVEIRGVWWNTQRIGLWCFDAGKAIPWRVTSAPGPRALAEYAHTWGAYTIAPSYIYRPTRRERQGNAKRALKSFNNVRTIRR